MIWFALLGACTSGEQDATRAGGTSPQATELTVLLTGVIGAWPSGLDPATNVTGGVNLSLMNAIFGGLFQLTADADGRNPRITGVLASGYEVSDGGRSLVIRLREGLRFSDGTPLDAEAVRFNVRRAIESPCSCAPTRWPWAKAEPVSVVDDLTVRLNFTRPYAAGINGLPVSNLNWIASPSALAAVGEEAFKLKPVGAGPFKVVSNQLSTRLELERNPLYWEPGRPYLDRLVFVPIGSEQAAYLSLIAGDADIAEGISSVALIEQALREGRVEARGQPANSPYLIQLNTRVKPFDDMRAREAIYYATDVEAIRKALFHGWASASQSFTGPGGLFHRERVPGYREYDLARARALVAELGGLQVKLATVGSVVNEQLITALQSQWQEAGMEVSIELYELATLIRAFQSGEWQALLQTAGSYDPEAAPGVSFRFRSDQVFSGVHDPDLDRMLLEAAAEIDPQRREDLYAASGKHISDRAYAPYLFAFAPAVLTRHGVEGPGLSTQIPPVAMSTAVLWQDVRVGAE
jgi:peptide/nickel transport system substrate-binding protein